MQSNSQDVDYPGRIDMFSYLCETAIDVFHLTGNNCESGVEKTLIGNEKFCIMGLKIQGDQ